MRTQFLCCDCIVHVYGNEHAHAPHLSPLAYLVCGAAGEAEDQRNAFTKLACVFAVISSTVTPSASSMSFIGS